MAQRSGRAVDSVGVNPSWAGAASERRLEQKRSPRDQSPWSEGRRYSPMRTGGRSRFHSTGLSPHLDHLRAADWHTGTLPGQFVLRRQCRRHSLARHWPLRFPSRRNQILSRWYRHCQRWKYEFPAPQLLKKIAVVRSARITMNFWNFPILPPATPTIDIPGSDYLGWNARQCSWSENLT